MCTNNQILSTPYDSEADVGFKVCIVCTLYGVLAPLCVECIGYSPSVCSVECIGYSRLRYVSSCVTQTHYCNARLQHTAATDTRHYSQDSVGCLSRNGRDLGVRGASTMMMIAFII